MRKSVEKSCDGKVKYANEIAVQYHLSSNKIEGIEDYYKCSFCDHFHVFTVPSKKRLSNKKVARNYELRTNIGPRKMKMSGRSKSGHGRKRK